MLSPILHPASNLWLLGKIENHTAHPLTREEIEAHVARVEKLEIENRAFFEEKERLARLCSEQAAALKWAKEILSEHRRFPSGETGPG